MKLSKRSVVTHTLSSRVIVAGDSSAAVIEKMRGIVKRDKVVIDKFKEYGVSLDEIDTVEIEFKDMDVSAKTKNRKIYLNSNLLKNDIREICAYAVHELVHYLQQTTGKNIGSEQDDQDYLSKPSEIESFKAQTNFKKRHEGEEAGVEYVEDLVSYHNLKGREKADKERELLSESN